MNVLNICIFNQSRNEWLQDDERSWGPFYSAACFAPGNEQLAEDIRIRETKGDDVTYTMAVLS